MGISRDGFKSIQKVDFMGTAQECATRIEPILSNNAYLNEEFLKAIESNQIHDGMDSSPNFYLTLGPSHGRIGPIQLKGQIKQVAGRVQVEIQFTQKLKFKNMLWLAGMIFVVLAVDAVKEKGFDQLLHLTVTAGLMACAAGAVALFLIVTHGLAFYANIAMCTRKIRQALGQEPLLQTTV